MATSSRSHNIDVVTSVFPLNLNIEGKNYKVLTKTTDIKFIADNVQKVTEELKTKFPEEPPNEPIYIEVKDGKIVVPQAVMVRNDNRHPRSSEDHPSTSRQQAPSTPPVNCSSSGTSSTSSSTADIQETYDVDENDYFEDDSNSSNSRFDWKITTTRQLLNILIDKKKASSKDFVLTKKIWPYAATELRTKVTGSYPSFIQCREKFYSLKRGYRKFLTESKRTGNKRPRPFYFEDEMQFLLEGDPAFTPLILKSSFGANEINDNVKDTNEDQDTDDDTEKSSAAPNIKKSKRCKMDDLKEYFAERDEKFMAFMREMNEKNNSVLEKLIDKL